MPNNAVDKLVEKWLCEPGFKTKLTDDPEGTVRACGISLSADEWATLRNVVMTSSNQELQNRISKGQGWN